jgi:hypothetical protein
MAGDDPEYIRWLKGRPCRECGARVTGPHHKTGAGMGLRAPDRDAIDLCGTGSTGCHGALHSLSGRFKGWTKERRRGYEADAVRQLNAEYDEGF